MYRNTNYVAAVYTGILEYEVVDANWVRVGPATRSAVATCNLFWIDYILAALVSFSWYVLWNT